MKSGSALQTAPFTYINRLFSARPLANIIQYGLTRHVFLLLTRSQRMGATTLCTRQDVAARVLAGEHLIVYHDLLLRIPQSWLDAHPGGSLALLHFVGRDATDEIEAYHTDDTLRMVKRFSIGRVDLIDDVWEPFVPPIMSGWVRKFNADGKLEWHREASAARSAENTPYSSSSQILLVDKDDPSLQSQSNALTLATISPSPTNLSLKVQARHSKAYRELHKRITAANLYETPYLTGYGPEIARYLSLAAISAYAYSCSWFITSAIVLGLMWHQLVFSAHDLGHMGVTHNWTIDRMLGILIADFIGGLSIGWWVEVSDFFFHLRNLANGFNHTEP
jgi:delta8-fatty-acid desaturase